MSNASWALPRSVASLRGARSRAALGQVAVICWPRVVDFRSFSWVLHHLGARGRAEATRRIGPANLLHDGVATAVGFWRLDLSDPEDHYVMQELLHLAALEPGDNIAECEYCGSFFDIPPGWLEGVPHEGTISFFYCREAAVVAKVLEDGAWGKLPMLQDRPKRHELAPLTSRGVPTEPSEAEHAQLHHRFKSGAGRRARKAGAGAGAGAGSPGRAGIAEAPAVDWKWFEKVRLVKFALWQRASTAEEVFEALDADGGGSLSREEVSAGLLAMGILLAPAETRLLLDTIDVDASGEVDALEFSDFWAHAPPLRLADAAQRRYWLRRGVAPTAYDALVPFYDCRALYPAAARAATHPWLLSAAEAAELWGDQGPASPPAAPPLPWEGDFTNSTPPGRASPPPAPAAGGTSGAGGVGGAGVGALPSAGGAEAPAPPELHMVRDEPRVDVFENIYSSPQGGLRLEAAGGGGGAAPAGAPPRAGGGSPARSPAESPGAGGAWLHAQAQRALLDHGDAAARLLDHGDAAARTWLSPAGFVRTRSVGSWGSADP